MTNNNKLPYRVELTCSPTGIIYSPPTLVSLCNSKQSAEYIANLWGSNYTRIVGPGEGAKYVRVMETSDHIPDYDPDDVAFIDALAPDEPSGNSAQLPRLVPVEREGPTLDEMPEWERHLCMSPTEDKVWMMSVNGCAWYASDPPMRKSPLGRREYTVLDAEPQQQTVDDLRPGDVAKVDGMWMLCTSQFNFVMLGGTHSGYFRSPRRDTPIGKVYRFEVPQ